MNNLYLFNTKKFLSRLKGTRQSGTIVSRFIKRERSELKYRNNRKKYPSAGTIKENKAKRLKKKKKIIIIIIIK